jgi:hypothetical protein
MAACGEIPMAAVVNDGRCAGSGFVVARWIVDVRAEGWTVGDAGWVSK